MYINVLPWYYPQSNATTVLLGMRSRVAGILHMARRKFYQRGDERSPFEVPQL